MSFEAGSQVQVFKSKISHKYYISEKVYLEPLMVYNVFEYNGNATRFMQAKIKIGYELNKI